MYVTEFWKIYAFAFDILSEKTSLTNVRKKGSSCKQPVKEGAIFSNFSRVLTVSLQENYHWLIGWKAPYQDGIKYHKGYYSVTRCIDPVWSFVQVAFVHEACLVFYQRRANLIMVDSKQCYIALKIFGTLTHICVFVTPWMPFIMDTHFARFSSTSASLMTLAVSDLVQ